MKNMLLIFSINIFWAKYCRKIETLMKTLWIYVVAVGIISFGLFSCQATADKTFCEPTTSPFPTPPNNAPSDVRFAYSPNITICPMTGNRIMFLRDRSSLR
jgi:hypothetical protein